MKILETRPEQCLVLEDNGQVVSVPTGEYYKMRYFDYNNRKINYIFSDDMYVMETNNQRIFNIWCEGERFQLRQDLSNNLVKAILDHRESGNTNMFKYLVEYARKETVFYDILNIYIKHMKNIEKTHEGYVIYEQFLVDYKGNAWVKKDSSRIIHDVDKEWHSICLVMKGSHPLEKIPNDEGGMTRVNPLTMAILTKIMFLINPNMQDGVFTDQLSNKLKIMLNKMRGR